MTDRATYAYLCDVYVLESHRGLGLGKWLIETVMAHPDLQGLRRFQLVTRDAHGLYSRHGFAAPADPERHMEIFKHGMYSTNRSMGAWVQLGAMRMFKRLATYLSFVRFSHSVFALPFALTGALLASRLHPVTWRHVAWIVVCMVTARSAAMGFNRLVDARFDAANPRTSSREIPSGRMSTTEATVFVVVMSIAFVAAAAQLSWLCFVLSPLALIIIFWYSLAKRYMWGDAVLPRACHGGRAGWWMAGRRRRRGDGSPGYSASRSRSGSAASTCCTPARISTSIDAST